MKITVAKCVALLLALSTGGLGTAWATSIDDKLDGRLALYITASPSSLDQKAEYALAVLKLWGSRTPAQQANANAFIDEVCSAHLPGVIPPTGSNETVLIWFQMPVLARMLLDPAMNVNLTAANKANIRRVLWEFISPRCKMAEANGTVWLTRFGENKSVIEKATCLLGSMALQPLGDGYDGAVDNNSIDAQVNAWKGHFYEYFRQRGREGLMCEIATGYNSITGGIWLIVRDMMDTAIGNEPELKDLVDKAITLFLADYATDFVPTIKVRAIASSRIYKTSIDAIGADPFRSLTYAYEWHIQPVGPAPGLSNWMVSSYRPPLVNTQDILKNIATDAARPSYLSTSRRLGRGIPGGTLKFGPNHTSDVRRDLWYTRNYAMGGLTLKTDPASTYMDSGGPSLDRLMGLVFSDPNDGTQRIVFYGSGDDTGDDTDPLDPQTWVGTREINSVSGEGCFVAGRDPRSDHPWVKLFISDGAPATNRADAWGWIFTHAPGAPDEVFVAIRICEGATATQATNGSGGPTGYALRFLDSTAPVVIQTATSVDYPGATGFDDFKSAVQWNWALHPTFYGQPAYDPVTNKVDYHSLAGDRYEFWGNSANLPRKNGADLDLNPAKTFDSPYVNSDHGREFVTVGDGTNAIALDFNFTAWPRRDDYQTLALWHMDAIAAGKVADDDTEVLNRNRDLTLVGGATVVADTVTSNGYRPGVFGKVLSLNGANSASAGNWPSLDNMVIDFWFKPDRDVGFNQTLASASNIWEIRLEGTNIRFFTWDAAGAVRSRTATGTGTMVGTWHHIHAEISNVAGQMSLTVDGVTQPSATGNNMKTAAAPIEIGFKTGTTRYFAGRIDDVKIRRWSDQ